MKIRSSSIKNRLTGFREQVRTSPTQTTFYLLCWFVGIVLVPKQIWNIFLASTAMKTDDDVKASYPAVRFDSIPTDEKGDRSVLRYVAIFEGDESSSSPSTLTMADWIRLMKEDTNDIALHMTKLLQDAPFAAFRFETPGVSAETVESRPFEFVLIKDTNLETFAAQEDRETFAEHLNCVDYDQSTLPHGPAACAFKNLGGDAILVVPRQWEPDISTSNYHGHLANFVRGASLEQTIGVWRSVASALEEQLLGNNHRRPSSNPLWLSTAGDGVAWLHFRLDSKPKYYHFRPYREFLKR